MKKHIPNILTLLNLLSGTIGIYLVLHFPQNYGYAAFFIFFSAIFDFLDGFVARLLKVSSEIGKQLDSLADLVSFGLLPSFIMLQIIDIFPQGDKIKFLALMIVIFSALRLAKFNVDETQKTIFVGLPTPSLALLVAGIAIDLEFFSINPLSLFLSFYVIVTVLGALLLVSPVKFFSLKLKRPFGKYKLQFAFLAISVILIAVFKAIGLTYSIILYIILSIIFQKNITSDL